MARQKAEIVIVEPDIERILASISYVISVAEAEGFHFTQYDVVKSLFLADRNHLNRYGRLISSDTYVAMVHGPVPTVAYDLLKGNDYTKRRFGLNTLPWQAHSIGHGKFLYTNATTENVDDVLSPSDKTALEAAIATVSSLSFGQIRKLTHEDAAYLDAWEDDCDRKQFSMSLGLLFDTPNFEKAREIMDVSKL